jgi:hypothetical protein
VLSTANPHSITLSSDRGIKANFESTNYNIYVIVDTKVGRVVTDPVNTMNLLAGTRISLSASAKSGYKFLN